MTTEDMMVNWIAAMLSAGARPADIGLSTLSVLSDLAIAVEDKYLAKRAAMGNRTPVAPGGKVP